LRGQRASDKPLESEKGLRHGKPFLPVIGGMGAIE
jgi:hypothetical protein